MFRQYLENHDKSRKLFAIFYRLLPGLVFCTYGFMVILLIMNGDGRIWKIMEVPFVVFVGITIIRKCIDAPRPYEVLNVPPLIKKDKKGQSFPSRHVVSAVIISMAGIYINIWLGIILLLISVLIGFMRVVAGVHFVKDVVGGFAISIITGIIGFFII